jgi:hypothetical protein
MSDGEPDELWHLEPYDPDVDDPPDPGEHDCIGETEDVPIDLPTAEPAAGSGEGGAGGA